MVLAKRFVLNLPDPRLTGGGGTALICPAQLPHLCPSLPFMYIHSCFYPALPFQSTYPTHKCCMLRYGFSSDYIGAYFPGLSWTGASLSMKRKLILCFPISLQPRFSGLSLESSQGCSLLAVLRGPPTAGLGHFPCPRGIFVLSLPTASATLCHLGAEDLSVPNSPLD